MKSVNVKVGAVLTAVMLLAVSSACSFSRSSRSSSRSSSQKSEAPVAIEQEPEQAQEMETSNVGFQEEIAAIAVLYVGASGSAEDFQRDISAAAKRNGIPYWELDERVFTAIGIGLERVGVKRQAIASLPFLQGVRNATNFNAIGNAYGQSR